MPTTYPGPVVRINSVTQGVELQSDTTTTSSTAANNWFFEILKNNATVFATHYTHSAELIAYSSIAMTNGTLAARTVVAGNTLQLRVTKTGTPTDLSTARLTTTFDMARDL